jgi:hypothetical protein
LERHARDAGPTGGGNRRRRECDVARQSLRKFPEPDFAIALHDKPELETGKVGYTPGYAMASATSIDIKIRGVGGHGSAPERRRIRLSWLRRW